MDWFLYDNGLRHERVKHDHDLKKADNYVRLGKLEASETRSSKNSCFENLEKLLRTTYLLQNCSTDLKCLKISQIEV